MKYQKYTMLEFQLLINYNYIGDLFGSASNYNFMFYF
jgi:hypothetical protein